MDPGGLFELRSSRCGLFRIAGAVESPAALVLRIFVGSAPDGRYAAAGCFLIGAILSRYGLIWTGRVSAHDPHTLFDFQRKRKG
jgi:hypothetical protein